MVFRRVCAVLVLLSVGCGESSDPIPAPALAPEVKTPAVSINEILGEAQRTIEVGNLGTAAALLEEAVKLEPTHRQALFRLATVDQMYATRLEPPHNAQYYRRSAEVIAKLKENYPELTPPETDLFRLALFHEACMLAEERKADKAIEALTRAVDAGFARLETLRGEQALTSLRGDARFQKLVRSIEEKAQAEAKRTAAERLASGSSFPFDFERPNVDGKPIALSQFRGKVVVIDFWGTWCGPCRSALPHLIELDKKFRDRGLQVIGLNFEQEPPRESIDLIRAAIKTFEIPYPCLIGDDSVRSQVPEFGGFPTTLFIDRSGKVRVKESGFNPDGLLETEALISLLLDEAPPTEESKEKASGKRN